MKFSTAERILVNGGYVFDHKSYNFLNFYYYKKNKKSITISFNQNHQIFSLRFKYSQHTKPIHFNYTTENFSTSEIKKLKDILALALMKDFGFKYNGNFYKILITYKIKNITPIINTIRFFFRRKWHIRTLPFVNNVFSAKEMHEFFNHDFVQIVPPTHLKNQFNEMCSKAVELKNGHPLYDWCCEYLNLEEKIASRTS